MTRWDTRSSLDRMPLSRSREQLDQAWTGARLLFVDDAGRLAADGDSPRSAPAYGTRRPDDVLLGEFGGTVYFARPVPDIDGPRMGMREAPPEWSHVVAGASALMNWHRTRPHCDYCGSITVPDDGGQRRLCPDCGSLAFARQDPAIIVAVRDPADRLLLGRQVTWAPGRCSVLAGFVEAGESAEQACHREIYEESHIRLRHVRYVSSQPWPYPRSLMLGFAAWAEEGEPKVDGIEMAEASYLTRQELTSAVAEGRLTLPGGASIARQLIDSWLRDELPSP